MKILQLCHKPPKPSIDGGCIAMNNITEGLLKNKCKLKIITIGTQKHPIKFEELHQNYLERTKIEGVFVDTKLNYFAKKNKLRKVIKPTDEEIKLHKEYLKFNLTKNYYN